MRINKVLFVIVIILLVVLGIVIYVKHVSYQDTEKEKEVITIDMNKVLEGAKKYISMSPEYSSDKYEGGYPPNGVGACTDVIWYAYQNAGFILKDEIDKDIKVNYKDYGIDNPDPDIDFRRVRNLYVFFDKYAQKLPTSLKKVDIWQPGDIVIFENYSHIAIISDKKNGDGIPYIIHHSATKGTVEDDDIRNQVIMAHFRFNKYEKNE